MATIIKIRDLDPDKVPVTIKARPKAVYSAPQQRVSMEGRLEDETGTVAFAVWKACGIRRLKVENEYIFYRAGLGKREGQLEVRIRKDSEVFLVKDDAEAAKIMDKISRREEMERKKVARGGKITRTDRSGSRRNFFSILITVGVIGWLTIMALFYSGVITEDKIRDFISRKKTEVRRKSQKEKALQPRQGEVREVMEGGLFRVRVGEEDWLVYLIGLDVPQMPQGQGERIDPLALRALNTVKYLILNKEVRLEFEDWLPPEKGEAWAYVFSENQMINTLLLERGLAKLRPAPEEMTYAARLEAAEDKARTAKRGVWRR